MGNSDFIPFEHKGKTYLYRLMDTDDGETDLSKLASVFVKFYDNNQNHFETIGAESLNEAIESLKEGIDAGLYEKAFISIAEDQ